MTEPSNSDRPPLEEAAASPAARGQTAATVAFLVLVAGVLAFYRTTDRPLFTAHEARAARCARHMLRSDEWPEGKPSPWLVPQFSPDAPEGIAYQKPPLYYWAVAAVSLVGGDVTRLTVRLPSAAGFVLLVVIVYFLGRTVVSHRTGLVSALVFASTPKVLWWGRAAVLDPMLTACIAGSLLFFLRAHLAGMAAGPLSRRPEVDENGEEASSRERPATYRRRLNGVGNDADVASAGGAETRRARVLLAPSGAWQMYLFWALAGLGTLVKATALVVPLLAAGLYLLARMPAEGWRRPLARLKPVTGPLVLLLVAAPWHVAAHVATGGAFSRIYWGVHVFGRATGTSVFEETTAWWYYLPAMARDLFPWVVFLPGALVQVWRRPSKPYRGRLLLPLVWFVGSLVFFSAVSFRKDEYMLGAYPAAAVLIGYFLDYYVEAQHADARLRKWVVAAFVLVAAAAVAMAGGWLALGLWPAAREAVLEALHNRTDRAVVSAMADLLAGRVWVAVLLAGPVMVGAVVSVAMVVRRRAAGAVALTVCTTLLAFVLFVEVVVPVLGRVRGLADFADVVRAEAVRRGPETRVLLAVAECHELAFILDERAEGLRAHPEAVDFLNRRAATGRPWLLVTDRRAWDGRRWSGLAGGWHVVAETVEGHRRPMVCAAPRTVDE
ncbi:MAG: glycosyltransferase family 39 protein [Phycisphaerae bacterium]